MSILDWLSSKKPAKTAAAPESSSLGHLDATAPLRPSDRLRVKLAPAPIGHAANHKTERLAHRELIYRVVRDAMIRAGVLAASYKFKVLSLDARGQQYLIMLDLFSPSAGDTARLAEIEAMMAQMAKKRHDMTVTAVYWRVSEQVTAGLPRSQSVPSPQPPRKGPELQASHRPATPVTLDKQAPQYEPLQHDEVAAFKRARARAAPAAALAAPGQIVTSGRRNPAPPVEFEDTQMAHSDERASPLSMTQYGDLN